MESGHERAGDRGGAQRRAGLVRWGVSLVAGAALLALASTQIQLWPSTLTLPEPELWWLAIAVHVPYALVRALRLRFVLDALVERASAGARRRLSSSLLYGSGLLGFFLVILLPLRLGELSRPLLLARGREPGVGVPEAVGAVAVERVVDGLFVVALLFGGLAFAGTGATSPELAERMGYVRWFGEVMACVFGAGLVVLALAGRAPTRAASWTRGLLLPLSPRVAELVAGTVERVARALQALYSARRGLPFLAWSLLYWAITVGQLWLVLHACGLSLGLAEAAAVVALIGLSIQLPGGPAQAGSFQLGAIAALGLFASGPIGDVGSSFAALMYLLQLGGAAVLALPGALLLARHARRAGHAHVSKAPSAR